MKIFEKGSKTNFVDADDVIVGYDWKETDCCENPGWFLADHECDDIIEGHGLAGTNLKHYYFDRKYFKQFVIDSRPWGEDLFMAIFRLSSYQPGQKDLYLHLYNEQNGYYCHGFEACFEDGDRWLRGAL